MARTPIEFADALCAALGVTDPDTISAVEAVFDAESLTVSGLALKAAQLVATMKSRNLFGPEVALAIDVDGLLDMGTLGPETHVLRVTGTGPVLDMGATATLLNPYYFGYCAASTTFTADPDRIITTDGEDLVVGAGGNFFAQYVGETDNVGCWRVKAIGQGPQGDIGPQGDTGATGPAPWGLVADWATATAYAATAPRSIVVYDGSLYICLIAHTSGAFDTDLAADKWRAVTTAGATTWFGDDPPEDTGRYNQWWDTSEGDTPGRLRVLYPNGGSPVWVDASPTVPGPAGDSGVITAAPSVVALSALTARRFVNVYSGGVRYADASSSVEAHGWIASAAALGEAVAITFGGLIEGLSGLTPGPVWLGEDGALVQAAPSSALLQRLGLAISSTSVVVTIQPATDLG